MSNFKNNIAPFVKEEISSSSQAEHSGLHSEAFSHLEVAHVLGQESTYWHVKVHCHMLVWGIKHRDTKEILGQLLRIIGAALFTYVKGVPVGNTGGSNVSALKVMPIKPELSEIIAKAKIDA